MIGGSEIIYFERPDYIFGLEVCFIYLNEVGRGFLIQFGVRFDLFEVTIKSHPIIKYFSYIKSVDCFP